MQSYEIELVEHFEQKRKLRCFPEAIDLQNVNEELFCTIGTIEDRMTKETTLNITVYHRTLSSLYASVLDISKDFATIVDHMGNIPLSPKFSDAGYFYQTFRAIGLK